MRLILLSALLFTSASAAVIEGRIALPKARPAPVLNKRYEIVTKGGVVTVNPPLAVIWLVGDFPRAAEVPVAEMPQRELAFMPALLAVRTGTRVFFPNFDDTYHNIFSYSAPKRFDLGRYRADEQPVPSQVFDVPGLVTLRCDIHDHMRGLILVLDSPHFVTSDPAGNYRLEGLPAGRYTLKVWLDSRTQLERAVELAADSVLRADFP